MSEIEVVALTPEIEADWDEFVTAHAEGTHYHRAGWARVIRQAFGQEPLYRAVRSAGRIEAVLPLVAFANPLFGRYLVSVPYLNRGGILSENARAHEALVLEARRLLAETRSSFCELRHVEAKHPEWPARESKVSMSIDVSSGKDELWKSIGPKVRNLVRKAEKSGLVTREGEPSRDLPLFYDLFAENMRDLGTPVYSPTFFREVCREFPDSVRLNVVEGEDGPAAAGICVRHGDFVEMHWAASRRELLKLSPNMALYWDSISWAADHGIREFCFGRSTEGSGPWRFKKQWGAEPTRLHWEYLLPEGGELPGLNPDNPKYKLAVRVWSRLPLPVTRWLGPPIVRHLP
ncbi:MAG: FemAB family PEP-CTERM system-associated protein [Gemmatimonadetes bacterium]|nr:FemAB family PEP-CTERM system-associated protein [Gemmatimonadota bacterium]